MLELSQIIALVIFVLLFAAIIIGKVHRFIPAVVAGLLVIFVVFLVVMRKPEAISNVLNLGQIVRPTFWIPGHI
jgi:hypothetical protein